MRAACCCKSADIATTKPRRISHQNHGNVEKDESWVSAKNELYISISCSSVLEHGPNSTNVLSQVGEHVVLSSCKRVPERNICSSSWKRVPERSICSSSRLEN